MTKMTMAPYCYDHPRPAVTADVCLFTVVEEALRILLIKRGEEPFLGSWALPGGFLREDETLEDCAARELHEEAGVSCRHLEAFATFSQPDRDPRTRVVTVAFLALVPEGDHHLKAGTDAVEAKWHSMARLSKLAFDHKEIIRSARDALIDKVEREPLSLALLPARFTLTQLQKIHEAIADEPLDKRNFRRSILAKGWVIETGDLERGRQRPAMLYEKA